MRLAILSSSDLSALITLNQLNHAHEITTQTSIACESEKKCWEGRHSVERKFMKIVRLKLHSNVCEHQKNSRLKLLQVSRVVEMNNNIHKLTNAIVDRFPTLNIIITVTFKSYTIQFFSHFISQLRRHEDTRVCLEIDCRTWLVIRVVWIDWFTSSRTWFNVNFLITRFAN